MQRHSKLYRVIATFAAVLVFVAQAACTFRSPSATPGNARPGPAIDELKMQSLVMDMADDYIAALGESVYLLVRSGRLDSKGRWLAQSFLRNGVGASLDIAVGPNPPVSLLDLLVLISLQTWSFENHWIPSGIGEPGRSALQRLKVAEQEAWNSARIILTDDQLRTVRVLVDAWISENPDRTVVALVRFDEFADDRRISSSALREQASGLLHEVSEASSAVDEARLLGERLLWYAGRYPYVLGEQAELTAYRLIDQPEGLELVEAMKSARQLSDSIAKRIETIQGDLEQQQAIFFSGIASERKAAIAQLQSSLEATVKTSLNHVSEEVSRERIEAINQLFDRLAKERTLFLDDLSARETELLGMMTELRETIAVSGALATNLTGTVDAIDRVLGHFDRDPDNKSEPLRMVEIRDAAIETGRAADRLTVMLEQASQILESESLGKTVATVTSPADDMIDRLFWRGVILICLLIAGIGLLRLVPQRITNC